MKSESSLWKDVPSMKRRAAGDVLQVGAVTNTFNVPGVTDHCFFLKSAEDARAIRERVNACFELANLPDSSPEDRKRLLSFVIVRS